MIALALACGVFSLGMYAVLTRRDFIGVLVGAELMLGAASLLLVSFGAAAGGSAAGVQAIATIVLVVSAAEAAIGLSLLLGLFRRSGRSRVEELNEVTG